MERQRSYRGFTLMELLVVIAMIGIVFGLAVPSFTDLMERQRSWSALNELRTSLHQARGLAARSGVQVSVCRSADQTTCMTGDLWSEGWIVFEDVSGKRDCILDTYGVCDHGGRALSVSHGVGGGGMYITANHFIKDTVRFSPEGFAMASNGTFTACSSDGEILRGMVLAWSGRVRVAEAGDNTSC